MGITDVLGYSRKKHKDAISGLNYVKSLLLHQRFRGAEGGEVGQCILHGRGGVRTRPRGSGLLREVRRKTREVRIKHFENDDGTKIKKTFKSMGINAIKMRNKNETKADKKMRREIGNGHGGLKPPKFSTENKTSKNIYRNF